MARKESRNTGRCRHICCDIRPSVHLQLSLPPNRHLTPEGTTRPTGPHHLMSIRVLVFRPNGDLFGGSDSRKLERYSGAENLVDVRNRILRNTTEQFILHVMAMLTLTLFLEGTSMKVIPILSGIFLTARIAFQIGYISSPIKRAYGFASTFLPTVAVYAYCTFRMVQRLI